MMVTTAPAAAIADPTAVAAKNPSTLRTSSSLNFLPNHCSSSQAVRRVCSALRKPKAMESHALLPIVRAHAADPTRTAAATGRRALGPKAINTPTEMPEAGQKIAKPGSTRRIWPSRAARKYAMPVATASVTPPNHQRFRSPNRNRSPRFSFSNTLYTLHAVVKGLVAEHVGSDGSDCEG